MLLKSIEYENFRPFKGKQKIEFTSPNNANANVFVILGDNTHGKSTFVLSFIWCFYGVSKFARSKEILNRDIENKLQDGQGADAKVTVAFVDEGKEYTIKRTQRFIKSGDTLKSEPSIMSMEYIDSNGQFVSCGKVPSELDTAIRAMLPEELSSFFFFEGEKDNNITKKDLSSAVKNLLGLEAMAKMKEHLHGSTTSKLPATGSVLRHFESKRSGSRSIPAETLRNKIDNATNEISTIDRDVVAIKEKIEFYDRKIDEIKDVLRRNEPTKNIQTRLDKIETDLKYEQFLLNDERKKFVGFFNDYALDFFIYPLVEKAQTKLKEMNLDDKGLKGIEVSAIKELLQREKCLCGTELKPGTMAYKAVEEYIDILPPKSVGVLVAEMNEKLDASEEKAKSFYAEFESKYFSLQNTVDRIDRLEREKAELKATLKKMDRINSTQYEKDLLNFKNKKVALDEQKDDLMKKKGLHEENIKKYENELKKIDKEAIQNDRATVAYLYAMDLYNWVSSSYDAKEREMRERLERIVTEKFNNMYSGKRDVRIDSSYRIQITVNGQPLDDTGGLRVIQYFAYVGGLVQLASEVLNEKDDGIQLGEDYPLVLDAAFSHADEGHIKSISTELMKSTKQLVLGVKKNDWYYAEEALRENVAKIYQLNKISETYTVIEEVK